MAKAIHSWSLQGTGDSKLRSELNCKVTAYVYDITQAGLHLQKVAASLAHDKDRYCLPLACPKLFIALQGMAAQMSVALVGQTA